MANNPSENLMMTMMMAIIFFVCVEWLTEERRVELLAAEMDKAITITGLRQVVYRI